MSKDILLVVDAVSNEKGVEKEVIFEALEAALASAMRKRYGADADLAVSIDRGTGEQASERHWEIVADESDVEVPDRQLPASDARVVEAGLSAGDTLNEPLPSIPFGRIAAQTAKQVIVQKVREAERAQVVESYKHREGELVTGLVKRIERGNIFLDLGGSAEAFIARDEMIPRETVRTGDRLRGFLRSVRAEPKGPQLFISRTAPEFLIELFKLEVPEVGQGVIEIIGASRDPGVRAKIAVRSFDPRLDPVGACVGMRGSRVQSVSNELAGERIDIILWDENVAQYVINAMAPAEVISIVVDEDAKSMDIAVSEEKLSQAIGRGGQNVRLASQLTGWELNVMTEAEAQQKQQDEAQGIVDIFVNELGVDEEVGVVLVNEGFSSVEEVAYVPTSELLRIEEFDEEIVKALRDRARDTLLTKAIASEAQAPEYRQPSEDLLNLEGMDPSLAKALGQIGVFSMEELAEQSVDELLEIEGMDEERASKLIMTARAPWFE